MKKVLQLHEAKARLSELVDRAQAGEQVVISRHGRTVAWLVSPIAKGGTRRLGALRGRVRFRRGWDDPLPSDLVAALEGR